MMKWKWPILFMSTSFFIVFDQWTKSLITQKFQLGETVPIVQGFFNLTYVRNNGAAFGFLAGAHEAFRRPFFIIVPVVALFIIALIIRKLPKKDIRVSTSLALVISGALGNLLDRIQYGYVIDFLDFHWKYQTHFPAFNVADSVICVGVGLLSIDLLLEEKAETKKVENASHSIQNR